MKNLTNKVAIVTGGARGIGAGCAKTLANYGARVVITDVLTEAGEETAHDIRQTNQEAIFIHHDVTSETAWQAVFAKTQEHYGQIDILVNNAGIVITNNIEDITLEDARKIFDVNYFGVLMGCKLAVKHFKSLGGSIINISSNSSRNVMPITSAYGSSKAAVANLSKSIAVHCASSGYPIRVNSVHPGPIATKMILDENPDAEQLFASIIPMKRLGKPEEIGEVVAFLASDSSSFMTGEEIFVDGGMPLINMGG